MTDRTLAEQLLDAQVAWLVGQLTGDQLPALVTQDVDRVLDAAADLPLRDLVDTGEVKRIIRTLLTTVPPSTAASTLVLATADVLYDGPTDSFTLSDVIDREHVEGLVDEVLGMVDLAEKLLDELSESPLVAQVASRFVGRIVSDVLSANRAVAEKIPGVGGLMSLGAGAASRVMGAADKQLESLIGDTAGKGAQFAMRRLNKIVLDTLKDPTAKQAALQVFDLYADRPVSRLDQVARREDVHRVAGLLQDIAISGAPTEPVLSLADALVDGFFGQYGEYPVNTLLEELDITRERLAADISAIAPGIIGAAHRAGHLERLVRERLEPFFSSPEVAAILP